jgi:hypothetical protein
MGDFRKGVDLWRQNADLDAAEADAQHLRERRYLNVSPTLDGLVRVDGQLDPEAGQTVLTALRSITDPQQLDPTDTRTPRQRRADALVGICADHLADGDSPISGGFRPQVTVLTPLAALLGLSGGAELEDAGAITPETLRRICCDAAITRLVLDPDGMPLDVGRTTRVIPPWIRLALNLRDKGCVIPGCQTRPRYCDAHHILHWAQYGDTKLPNLCLLCTRHHTMVHEGTVRLPANILKGAGRLPQRE